MSAGAVAAIIIRRERDLVEHFETMRATSPETAQSVQALRVEQNMYFRRLEKRAVIRQSPTGLYYLDRPSWDAMTVSRRKMAIVMLFLATITIAAIIYTERTRVPRTTPPVSTPP